MAESRCDLVLIDFYGTIADGDRFAVETTCTRIVRDCSLPLTSGQLALEWGKRFFKTVDASNGERFMTLFDCECVSLAETLQARGIEMDPTPYARMLQRYWSRPPLHAEAKDALSALAVPVCCVSNADEDDLQRAIAAHGLTFDACVSSEKARSYKPHAGIFKQALRRFGVAPGRSIHVGDSLHSDVLGAQSLGIPTVWIERDGRISDIGNAVPDYTINSLRELPHIIKEKLPKP